MLGDVFLPNRIALNSALSNMRISYAQCQRKQHSHYFDFRCVLINMHSGRLQNRGTLHRKRVLPNAAMPLVHLDRRICIAAKAGSDKANANSKRRAQKRQQAKAKSAGQQQRRQSQHPIKPGTHPRNNHGGQFSDSEANGYQVHEGSSERPFTSADPAVVEALSNAAGGSAFYANPYSNSAINELRGALDDVLTGPSQGTAEVEADPAAGDASSSSSGSGVGSSGFANFPLRVPRHRYEDFDEAGISSQANLSSAAAQLLTIADGVLGSPDTLQQPPGRGDGHPTDSANAAFIDDSELETTISSSSIHNGASAAEFTALEADQGDADRDSSEAAAGVDKATGWSDNDDHSIGADVTAGDPQPNDAAASAADATLSSGTEGEGREPETKDEQQIESTSGGTDSGVLAFQDPLSVSPGMPPPVPQDQLQAVGGNLHQLQDDLAHVRQLLAHSQAELFESRDLNEELQSALRQQEQLCGEVRAERDALASQLESRNSELVQLQLQAQSTALQQDNQQNKPFVKGNAVAVEDGVDVLSQQGASPADAAADANAQTPGHPSPGLHSGTAVSIDQKVRLVAAANGTMQLVLASERLEAAESLEIVRGLSAVLDAATKL